MPIIKRAKTYYRKFTFQRILRFLAGLILLIGLSMLGDWLASYIPFPLPGPVLGLVFMLTLLLLGWIPLRWVDGAARFLLIFMGLFYVPYGVGIIDIDSETRDMGLKIILLALTVTLSVMFITGKLFEYLKSKSKSKTNHG